MTRELQALAAATVPPGASAPAPRAAAPARRPGSGCPQGSHRSWSEARDNAVLMRVLMIEDEVPLAEAVGRGLKREGYSVDYAHDGLTGLERARGGAYDAIILDVLLPKMNGYKVCETLRAEGVWTP